LKNLADDQSSDFALLQVAIHERDFLMEKASGISFTEHEVNFSQGKGLGDFSVL
jgi:hypothetical protein